MPTVEIKTTLSCKKCAFVNESFFQELHEMYSEQDSDPGFIPNMEHRVTISSLLMECFSPLAMCLLELNYLNIRD